MTGLGLVAEIDSLRAAAIAVAAELAADAVMLFRRVTRWLRLTAPREMEWEW
jgi:hypothetical protein